MWEALFALWASASLGVALFTKRVFLSFAIGAAISLAVLLGVALFFR
jgi:hypothetical protein